MRKLGVTFSTVLIVITAPVVVAAADLVTPLILVVPPEGITCTALNVSSQIHTVSVFVKPAFGEPISGGTPTTLDPGEGTGIIAPERSSPLFVYCQFTVDGKATTISAGAMTKPGGTFIPAQ